jgi:hypothetical protein
VAAGLLVGGPGGMVLLGLMGVTIGSLAAETHLLAPDRVDRPRRRTAALDRRRLADYWAPARQAVMAAVAVAAAVVLLGRYLNRLQPGTGGDWAMAALLLLVVAATLQWRVATRRRPALPSTLRFSDESDYPTVTAICWLIAIAQFWSHRGLGLHNRSRRGHVNNRSDDRGAMA